MEWFLDLLSEVFVWLVHGWAGWLGLAGCLLWLAAVCFLPGVLGIVLGFVGFAALLSLGIWLDRRGSD